MTTRDEAKELIQHIRKVDMKDINRDWITKLSEDAPTTSHLKSNMFIHDMKLPREIRFAYIKDYIQSSSPKYNTNINTRIKFKAV